jgi:hypothetical protein
MFKTLKAAETLGWYGAIGINGIPVFTPLTNRPNLPNRLTE